MLKERLDYQNEINPKSAAEKFQNLGNLLTDISGSMADAPKTVPDWIWHIDDPKQIEWLQNRIRQHVRDYHLEDIALSEDLVPSLRPDPNYRPTTIGPASQKKLTSGVGSADIGVSDPCAAPLERLQDTGSAVDNCLKTFGGWPARQHS